MLKRKGVALISVILIGALVFASIIGIVLKVVPEKNISVARVSSERALSAAEDAIARVYFELINANLKDGSINIPTDMGFPYLSTNKISQLASLGPEDQPVDFGEYDHSTNPYTTFWVKIKRLDTNGTWDPREANINTDGQKIIHVAIYALGTVYRGNSRNSGVAARKAIETEMDITYNKTSYINEGTDPYHKDPKPGSNQGVFNYALCSGVDINFAGNSQVIKGDIRTNGNITNQNKKVRVKDGSAYASGSIDDGIVSNENKKHEGYDTINPWPELSLDYYQSLYNNFLTGEYPYNGSPVLNSKGEQIIENEVPLYYPDTSNEAIQGIINTYLNDPTITNPLDRIEKFYSDLQKGEGSFGSSLPLYLVEDWISLRDRAKFILYYIDGDVHVNSNKTLSGTFVINGDLRINGNYTINSDGSLAFLVSGNIIKANGNAEVNGFLYADGGLSLGTGSFTVNGGIVTKETINVSGSIDVTYSPMYDTMLSSIEGEPGEDIPGSEGYEELVESKIDYVERHSSPSWKEISYDEFINP